MRYSVFCDESCHLESDKHTAMTIGALFCEDQFVSSANQAILEIKRKHNLSRFVEIKWNKISASKYNFYKDLVDYFFSSQFLSFRVLSIPDKSILRHEDFGQSHDDWYYKMYYLLLRDFLSKRNQYKIFIDIKDTKSKTKLKKLNECLLNVHKDSTHEMISQIQHVRSHDICLMQLSDLLIGAVSYSIRDLDSNIGKQKIIADIKEKSGFNPKSNSLKSYKKFNFFRWSPCAK